MKMLKELSLEELKSLYNTNNHFRNDINELKMDSADSQADDVLKYFRDMNHVYYSISDDSYSYMKVGYRSYKDFLSAVLKLMSEYCIEADKDKIERVVEKLDFYDDARTGAKDISDDKFNNLEMWVEECVNSSAAVIVEYVKNIFKDADEVCDDDLLLYAEDNEARTDGTYIYQEIKYA